MSIGEKNYRMWHAKEPNKTTRKKVKWLDQKFACPVGTGYQIGYSSAKWEKKPFQYIHDFGTPKVYFLKSQTAPGEAVGRDKTVQSLMGTSVKNDVEMAFLGTLDELTYYNHEGELVEVQGMTNAQVLCCPDRKGIMILSKKGVIFVRGGKMRVEARGIVD